MLYNTILRTLLLVFILIQNSTLYSQSINYKSNYYSIKDGLPSREIFDALQDSRGFIWLSSYKHLTRFDGYTFTDFSKLINPGQAKDIIQLNGEQTTLETVSPNHFLIKYATENPIFELINTNNIGIKRYNLSDFFKGKKIIDFIACPGIESIAVFCLEKNELEVYRFNPEANRIEEKLNFPIGLQDNSRLINVQITCNKKNGNVYFSAASIPVILFDLLQDTAYTLPVRISNIGYKKIKPLKENELALIDSEQNKLLIYNPITQKTAIIHHPLLSHAMDGIWTDLDGNIILVSIVNLIHKKLCLIEYETHKIISLDFLLKTEDLISQFGGDHFKDKLLLSTYSGFHTLINEKKRFKSLLTSDLKFGNFGHIMRNMIEDDKGGLYINEEKNHLFKLNMKSDTIEKIFKISPYPEVALNGSMKKIGNNLWGICAKTTRKDQLYSFDLNSNKFKYWALPTDAFAIKAMALGDSTQLICFGRDHITDSTMVFKFNTENGKWQYMNLGPDTPKGKYQYALKDKHRQIWLGTLKGLFLLHADLKTVEKVDFGPAENPQLDISVQSLVIHPVSNHLYIGTEYKVWIYDLSQKKYLDHITKESIGLCNDDVQAMIFKNNDELFVTTFSIGSSTANETVMVSSTNGKSFDTFDPHDLWHDRLAQHIPRNKVNKSIDEACAYLYGGSWGISWTEIFASFKSKVDNDKQKDWLTSYGKYENFGVSQELHLYPEYVINALLVQKIEKEKGFPAVLEFLKTGKNDPDDKLNTNYFKAVYNLTGISKENYTAAVWDLIKSEK